ncbi:OsmC family protein [Pseudomonas citronellolis]|uniref:OsmC family protein n=1 Tax=Pseudomonas citronellolis TaxID=53408 RepID=UPI0023E3C418|nr:OsmC family protein [Pseudomonas citronellolis]MDF3935882.1 OsmC family protein [Pseudomonas citronellolis]
MLSEQITSALQRLHTVLQRHPASGRVRDEPALARWLGDAQVATRHANGCELVTDLPAALGGSGERVSPGWLLRAALASCMATRIAMLAAEQGIALQHLEVEAHSQTDLNGLLGLSGEGGEPHAGPFAVHLLVRIGAAGQAPEALRELVERSQALSPVSSAIERPVPVTLEIVGVAA